MDDDGTDGAPGAWSWTDAQIREFGTAVLGLAVDQLTGQRDRPAWQPPPAGLRDRWARSSWPERGLDPDALLGELATIAAYPFGNGHPRFHAWVNSAPDRAAVLADLLATAMDPSVAGGNHAAVHVERQVVRWLADLVGLPAAAGGLLVSGASMATTTALAAARQRHAGFDVRRDGLTGGPPLVLYAGEEAHSSIAKAVELLGLGRRALRLLPGRTLDPARLRAAIATDRAAGNRPFAVVAAAGSVNTGSVDPLGAIADLCAAEGVWMHVDGAYGAPARLSERCRDTLADLGRADSVAVDPHKWLYVPVDAGALLVRDPAALRDAFSVHAAYLPAADDGSDELDAGPWISDYGPEQTRAFRALRVWAALAATGREGYRRLIDRDLDNAEHLRSAVAAHPELELLAAGLSIVAFRYAASDDLNDLNAELVRAIQLGGQSFVAPTTVDGRTAVRCCLVNPLTTPADLDALVELVVGTGRSLAGGR